VTKILGFLIVMAFAVISISAQTSSHLKQHYRKAGVVRVGPTTTFLKKGLTTEEVLRLLGEPANISERIEDGLVVTTYEFPRGAERVLVAQFVSDTLVTYRIETRAEVAQAIR
jgi:hypothetical protein